MRRDNGVTIMISILDLIYSEFLDYALAGIARSARQ
jgi:hypothetical protein